MGGITSAHVGLVRKGSTHDQKESKVRVVLFLVKGVGEIACLLTLLVLVQEGDDALCVSAGLGVRGQSGESGVGVEFEEGGIEVLALHEVDLFGFDVNSEFSADRACIRIFWMCIPLFKSAYTAISAAAAQTEKPKVYKVGCRIEDPLGDEIGNR